MHQPSAASLILGGLQGEPGREALKEVVASGEFFLFLLPDGSRLVHPIAMGERFPLNFGREVIVPSLPHIALRAALLQDGTAIELPSRVYCSPMSTARGSKQTMFLHD